MSTELSRVFSAFDRGFISRRQLLLALGVAAVVRPVSAFAQGQCGGARAGTPQCDPTPAKLPFASTGWRTVLLDHFSVSVADYQKEAAFYAALMNWKIRSDDGKQAMLDIGDWGGILIKGGYQPPTPPSTPASTPAAAAGAGAAGAAGQGRGGGGGGRGGSRAMVTGFCWGVDPWNAKTVEAELKKRGLDPIPDNDPATRFESFHVMDPGGFDVQISNGSRKTRRLTPASGKNAAAPFDSTAWKTLWLDHISFECVDYKASVAFYQALLGWKPGVDEGSQNEVQIGDIGGAIVRGTNMSPIAVEARAKTAAEAAASGAAPSGRGGGGAARTKNGIGHIAFGISPWDADAVKAELDKRSLNGRVDTGGSGDIHTAKYQSYHTTTPNGFDLQISNVIKREKT